MAYNFDYGRLLVLVIGFGYRSSTGDDLPLGVEVGNDIASDAVYEPGNVGQDAFAFYDVAAFKGPYGPSNTSLGADNASQVRIGGQIASGRLTQS